MAFTGGEGVALLVGRVLFGGVLAFMGVNHFLQTADMAGYAAHKGIPAPRAAVLLSGGVLVLGGVGIVLGVFPLVAAVAIALFLLGSALLMHDFWSVPADQRQTELTQFLKNVVMAGAALVIAAVSTQTWAFSAGIGF